MVTREQAAIRRSREAFRREAERATRTAENVITVCNFGATALTTGFVWSSRTADGTSFVDVGVTALVGGVLFFALQRLHRYGLRLIPHMDEENRARSVGVWGGLALSAALVSSTTSMLFLASPKAKEAHLERSVSEVTSEGALVIQAMRSAEGLAPMIESAGSTALIMADGESRGGDICQNGGGRGECHNILTAIAETSAKSTADILDARARAVPLIELMEDELDRLVRAQKDEDLSYEERAQQVQRSVTIVGNSASQLAALIPVAAIENAAAAYAREIRSMRISEVGAARIRAAFADTAARLRMKLGDLREAQDQTIEGFREIQPWDAIGQEFETVWTLCLIALLLDALPLGLCVIMIAVDRHRDALIDDEAGDDDARPPSKPRPTLSIPPRANVDPARARANPNGSRQ